MSGLFRKEAEDAFKERFLTNRQLSRITIPVYAATIVLFVGIFFYFNWLFTGEIMRTTELDGVVFPSAGISTAYVLKGGTISDVTVRAGDSVEMGEVLGIIPDDNALAALNRSDHTTEELKKDNTDRNDYINNSFIRSPANGYVVSILQKGRSVQTGDVFAMIAADSREFNKERVLVFLPSENKNGIKKGCKVQISLEYAKRDRYGYINGYVYDVSDNVITKKDALEDYDFYNIPNLLEDGKTYLPVTINFEENSDYESGLAWSLSSSGSIEPEPGTRCKCSVIIETVKAFEWLAGG